MVSKPLNITLTSCNKSKIIKIIKIIRNVRNIKIIKIIKISITN